MINLGSLVLIPLCDGRMTYLTKALDTLLGIDVQLWITHTYETFDIDKYDIILLLKNQSVLPL